MQIINYISICVVPVVILLIVLYGLLKKVPIFDLFLSGAKDGIQTTVNILPTLIGLFVAISMLRASGALELLSGMLSPVLSFVNFPSEVIPLALIRPISGSGALAIVNDILNNFGPDSAAGRVASVMMGSTETTFYTVAVYFGCLRITNIRYTVKAALIADITGIVISSIVVNLLLKG